MVRQLEQLSGRQISRLKFEFELSICWPDQPVRALIPAFPQVSLLRDPAFVLALGESTCALTLSLTHCTRLPNSFKTEKKREGDVNRVC